MALAQLFSAHLLQCAFPVKEIPSATAEAYQQFSPESSTVSYRTTWSIVSIKVDISLVSGRYVHMWDMLIMTWSKLSTRKPYAAMIVNHSRGNIASVGYQGTTSSADLSAN